VGQLGPLYFVARAGLRAENGTYTYDGAHHVVSRTRRPTQALR
jgi:hypothetical protein